MKRFLILCVLCALCGSIQAANEINAFAPGVTTAYAVVRQADGDVWYPTGQVFEVWGTGTRTAADYDIAMTSKSGGMFVGSFDTNITAQFCHLVTHYQAGAGPADTDPVVWQEYGYWSGTTWQATTITAATIADEVVLHMDANSTDLNTLVAYAQEWDPNFTSILGDTNELRTDWTNGGRLDLLIDAIKAITDLLPLQTTTVSDANDANSFTVTAGKASTDAYNGNWIMVEDATDSNREMRCITYWSSARVVEVDAPFTFTPDVADNVWIWTGYLGDLIEAIERNNSPINVFDLTGSGASAHQGVTVYDASGNDP